MIKAIVTTTIVSRHDTQRLIQFPLEIEDASSIAEVYAILTEEGALHGKRVNFDFLRDGRRMVRERIETIVGINAVATLAPCHYEYFEQDEVGADE